MRRHRWAIIPILIFLLWTMLAKFTQRLPMLQGKRILLLIAHPDDEAMFFGPTLLALTRPELNNHVKILCLSSGDADGLGNVRKRELVRSALHLGVHSESDVKVIEDTNFPDSMTTTWDPELITQTIAKHYISLLGADTGRRPRAIFDTIITFDASGISAHPNHISLYRGAQHFLSTTPPALSQPVSMYTLTTTSLLRKYVSVLDAPFTLLGSAFSASGKGKASELPGKLVFVSSVSKWRRAQTAMTTAHVSQMRWFRWGWIGLSRYMVVNDLVRENVS